MTAPIVRNSMRQHRREVHVALLGIVLASLAAAPMARAEKELEVHVERARPVTDKHPTLRFLRENRDFIRESLDRLREKLVSRNVEAAEIDPRFLAYRDMLANVTAAKDSGLIAEGERQRLDLLRSITQLGGLEAELDQLDRLLVAQRGRLGVLQQDFTGDQRTALAVVLSGFPEGRPVSHVSLMLEDTAPVEVPLSAEQRDALAHGGAVQIFHGYVEPREQVVQIAVAGSSGTPGEPGFVTLDPPRDRLMLLRLDLSQVHVDDGAASIHATTWLNDARVP